jgi:serine phosphatase RsbU (regulator of sigma subunit)
MPPAVSSKWTGAWDAPRRRSTTARDWQAWLVKRATRAMLHLEAGRSRRAAATPWRIALCLVPALLLVAIALDFFSTSDIEAGFFYALPILMACLLLGRWGAVLIPICLLFFHCNAWNSGQISPTLWLHDVMNLGNFSIVASLALFARLFYLDLAAAGQDLIARRRDLERELALAARLQGCLYNVPEEGYRGGGWVIHARCRPLGPVGGDLCHLMPHDDGVNLFVGDVIGKGVPAALIMSMCTAILSRPGRHVHSPGHALAECNRLLSRHFDQDPETVVTVTAFFGVLRNETGELVFSLAGHETPILLGEGPPMEHPCRGVVMGAVDPATYPEIRVSFEPGAKLVVFTDGAVEIRNRLGEEFGRERLEAAARRWQHLPSQELMKRLLTEIDAFAAGAPPRDDLALVVVEREGD